MRKICLTVEYDGTEYCGYQMQSNVPTVQGAIESAIFKLCGERVRTVAAGRTDAKVHALGQIVSFFTSSSIPDERFAMALNTKLPSDIHVRRSFSVRDDFNPRFDAIGKMYRYLVCLKNEDDPGECMLRNRACIYDGALDHEEMKRACALLIGEHDFASFCSSGSSVKTTTRNVTRFELSTFKDPFLGHTFLSFEVEANGFLYNMVRIMVSTVMEVGMGRLGLDEVSRILDGADRRLAPPPMPPQGLYLVKVDYDLMT